jgi:hypothetical protein
MAWLKRTRDDPDSKANLARYEEVAKHRLSQLTSSAANRSAEDPAVIEARLRNLTHGTSSGRTANLRLTGEG